MTTSRKFFSENKEMTESSTLNIIIARQATFKMLTPLALALLCWLIPLSSIAQFAVPLGDGTCPEPVTRGDKGKPLPPFTGQADQTAGHSFPTGIRQDRTIVFIHRQGERGNRVVQTIRGDHLKANELTQVEQILGVNFNSGIKAIDLIVDEQKLNKMQQVLFPYPSIQLNGTLKKITHDQPAQGYPRQDSSYRLANQLPTVNAFCRFFVILGVVSATIWMALAAYAMILGHPHGGKRVIGTAAGLMLLLTGYTIWKIVQINAFKATSNRTTVSQNHSIIKKFELGTD